MENCLPRYREIFDAKIKKEAAGLLLILNNQLVTSLS